VIIRKCCIDKRFDYNRLYIFQHYEYKAGFQNSNKAGNKNYRPEKVAKKQFMSISEIQPFALKQFSVPV